MAATASRTLALLDLLQTRRQWSGTSLAERLGVSHRTLRRDVDRLRELGYRITATRGTGGGYRLEAGAALPPLLLTDAEAVTMALGLRTVAALGLVDGDHLTLAALAKLEHVLPARLRRRVSALAEHVHPLSPDAATVLPDLLGQLALACRDHERIRFRYTDAGGARSDRVAEPHSLVAARRHWFLVAWDRDRADWRTFRVDRMDALVRTGVRDRVRGLPDEMDAAAFVARALSSLWHTDTVVDAIVELPVDELRRLLGPWAAGAVAVDERRTRWTIEFAQPAQALATLAWLPAGTVYRLEGDAEAVTAVAAAAAELARATAGADGAEPTHPDPAERLGQARSTAEGPEP